MKIPRPVIIVAIISTTLLVSNVLNSAVVPSKYIESFPSVVCPPTGDGLRTAVSLQSTKTPFKLIGNTSTNFKEVKVRRYNQVSSAAVFDSKAITPVVWQIRSGVWAGATICKSPISAQWFVGGASYVTIRGDILLVNSGLSTAIAELRIWNEISEQPNKVITIKPNSQISVGLDALAPGSKAIVMQVVQRAGRLNAFMIDQRGKGLQSLGGDIVNASTSPSSEIYIPVVPHSVKKANQRTTSSHTLRVLNPGDVDARISVTVASSSGSFVPVGLQDLVIPKGRVLSIQLNPNLEQGRFGLRINSEQPVVAAVFSPTQMKAKKDFIWSTAASEMKPFGLALTGLAPELVFIGKNISLTATIAYQNGKRKSFDINGEEFVAYQVPDNVRDITFSNVSKGIYGAALISTQSGSGYFPLEAGSVLTKSAVPTSSIQVLTP